MLSNEAKQFINEFTEKVASDSRYKKGKRYVKNAIVKIYNELVNEYEYESELLDDLDYELTYHIAKTGSIYISFDIYEIRISDHSKNRNVREMQKIVTGSVCGALMMTASF